MGCRECTCNAFTGLDEAKEKRKKKKRVKEDEAKCETEIVWKQRREGEARGVELSI